MLARISYKNKMHLDLERGGKALIAGSLTVNLFSGQIRTSIVAENNLADFKDMTPAELVAGKE